MKRFTALIPVTIECDTLEQAQDLFEMFSDAGFDNMPQAFELMAEMDLAECPCLSIGDFEWKQDTEDTE